MDSGSVRVVETRNESLGSKNESRARLLGMVELAVAFFCLGSWLHDFEHQILWHSGRVTPGGGPSAMCISW